MRGTKSRTRLVWLALAGIAAMLGTSCANDGPPQDNTGNSTGEPVVLRMANTYGELDQLPAVKYFVDRVDELSGGNIRITVADSYGNFTSDVEQRVVRHIATDKMDLGWVGTRVFDSMDVRSLQALTAPMLVDSYALQNAIIESGITKKMLPALGDLGVVGLGVLADGLRKPIGVNRPIVRPADWEGIGFGTYRSEGQERAVRAIGATPAIVFGPNREAAILDGTIRGFEMGLFIYQDPKWVDLAPYVTTNVNLWPQMDVLIASPDRLETLTHEQRGWLQQAADDAANRSAALADTEAEVIKVACDTGARFAQASGADLAALDDLFAPVYASLEGDAQTKAFVEQIQALKRSTAAEPDPPIPAGCTGKAPGGAGTATSDPLEGEWHQRFTCEEARRVVRRSVKPAVIKSSGWDCALPGTQLRIARFGDGRMVLLDPPSHEVGLNASYEVDDHVFTLREDEGTYRFEYRIEGDRLIVDALEENPFFVAAWEAAPFVRG